MKRSGFSKVQIVEILRENKAGAKAGEGNRPPVAAG